VAVIMRSVLSVEIRHILNAFDCRFKSVCKDTHSSARSTIGGNDALLYNGALFYMSFSDKLVAFLFLFFFIVFILFLLSLFIFFERGEHATIAWIHSAIQAKHRHHHHVFVIDLTTQLSSRRTLKTLTIFFPPIDYNDDS
jgi:hypothetical protein